MNLKKVMPLVAALVLGLIAARMIVKILANRQTISIVQTTKMPKVVIMKHSIGAGEKLTEEDLAMGELATDGSHGTFSEVSQVVGRVAIAPLVEGQAIQDSFLAARGVASGLQAVIPAGMRAVTVQIDEVSGVAGYLVPGARVDVYQTVRDENGAVEVSRAILQNIEVTAVGQHRNGPEDQNQGKSVTLLVTPHQAAIVELASMKGRPRLAMRGSGDAKLDEATPVTLTELTGRRTDAMALANGPTTRSSTSVLAMDPFAAASSTTRPSDPTWTVQIMTAGEANLFNIKLPEKPKASDVTPGRTPSHLNDATITHADTGLVGN